MLKHDFGNPDGVRIARFAPGKVAGIFSIPGQQRSDETCAVRSAECGVRNMEFGVRSAVHVELGEIMNGVDCKRCKKVL